uniref:AP2/ERF domain-containing protein n=1 Tax=Kalanchoe fedtschenkoi TaxID=63787 RepID=A0A7N0U969_KALFE
MSFTSSSGDGGASEHESKLYMDKKKFKGIRRRKWGKWVSEIRVPGTPNRLWLGSYSTAEAAAAAHQVASFYLRSASSSSMERAEDGMSLSPRSVQKAASDAGMAVDAAHRVFMQQGQNGEDAGNGRGGPVETWEENTSSGGSWSNGGKCRADDLNVSVDDYL